MPVSLKTQIMERLNLKKGGAKTASANIRKATKDFYKSDAPQFRGKSKAKRHQMAVAAGLAAARGESAEPQGSMIAEMKKGDEFAYQGKKVILESIKGEMAVVRRGSGRNAEIIVRVADLQKPQQLNEGVLGMGTIGPTWKERSPTTMPSMDLSPSDIGLFEDDDLSKKDDQEEDHDNGSNVRHDGHTGKKEVDELPTPSDTIAPAYTDEKPPKEISSPLSTEPGYTVAKDPDLDGYDYPADAPNIPSPDYPGEDVGNSRAPDMGGGHDAGDNLDKRGDSDDLEENYMGFEKLEKKLSGKPGIHNAAAVAASIGRKKYGKKKFQNAAASHHKMHEAFEFISEMDDMLGGDEREPQSGDKITVSLPAMASILVSVAHHMGADVQPGGQDEILLKSMVEALAEIGHGKTLDVGDLQAVAAHMNGEETQEIQNRDAGRPEHEGIEGERPEPADSWPGDMQKSRTGKTQVMDGVQEGTDFYGIDDILSEFRLTDEEELRLIKRRAGMKFW